MLPRVSLGSETDEQSFQELHDPGCRCRFPGRQVSFGSDAPHKNGHHAGEYDKNDEDRRGGGHHESIATDELLHLYEVLGGRAMTG